jgi:hypothetical protein
MAFCTGGWGGGPAANIIVDAEQLRNGHMSMSSYNGGRGLCLLQKADTEYITKLTETEQFLISEMPQVHSTLEQMAAA